MEKQAVYVYTGKTFFSVMETNTCFLWKMCYNKDTS